MSYVFLDTMRFFSRRNDTTHYFSLIIYNMSCCMQFSFLAMIPFINSISTNLPPIEIKTNIACKCFNHTFLLHRIFIYPWQLHFGGFRYKYYTISIYIFISYITINISDSLHLILMRPFVSVNEKLFGSYN